MARTVVLTADLLFGSKVVSSLQAAGIEVELVGDAKAAGKRIRDADVLIVDLTGEIDGAAVVESLAQSGTLGDVKTLGFYSHVDVETRKRALRAGFDLVVPRSRMAREGGELVSQLAASAD